MTHHSLRTAHAVTVRGLSFIRQESQNVQELFYMYNMNNKYIYGMYLLDHNLDVSCLLALAGISLATRFISALRQCACHPSNADC